jgi:hypothetical protein
MQGGSAPSLRMAFFEIGDKPDVNRSESPCKSARLILSFGEFRRLAILLRVFEGFRQ